MDPRIAFFIEHWALSSAFIFILVLILVNEWRHRSFGIRGITSAQLVDLLNHASGVVVDVRSREAFDRGHILNAINIPQADFAASTNSLNKYKTKPLILVCAQGLNSPQLGKVLKEQGFNQLFYLSGGVQAWQNDNLPTVKN